MAKAKKLPSGNWRCLVYDHSEPVLNPDSTPALDKNGKPKQKRIYESFTADTRKEAEYQAAEFVRDKDQKKRPDKITVQEAVRQYIDTKKAVLSPSTIRGYEGLYKNHFGFFQDIPLRELRPDAVQVWVGTLAPTHSPKTVQNAHGLLSATLDMFLPDFRIRTTLPQRKKPELYVPSDNDIQRLLEHIKGRELEIAVLLAAFGPLRRGEICALESTDISGNTVSVTKSMVQTPEKTWEVKPPKTYGSYRCVELPDFVIKRMDGIDGRIVKATPMQITNRFTRAVHFAGLPHFRFHDLRHYSASIMHAIGIPDQYIMQRGGWSSDNVLKTVYRNTIDDQTKRFNKNINLHFSKVMQHEMQHSAKKR